MHVSSYTCAFFLNWVINNIFKVTWQAYSTARNNIKVSQLLVLQLTHSIFMFRNLRLKEYIKVKQAHYFSNSWLFVFLLPQSLLSPTRCLTCQGLSGILVKQHIIRDPVRLWNLLGESQKAAVQVEEGKRLYLVRALPSLPVSLK